MAEETSGMADVIIRMRPNGPILVEGPFKLINSRGRSFSSTVPSRRMRAAAAASPRRKPFCDGTHKTCGFISDERATTS